MIWSLFAISFSDEQEKIKSIMRNNRQTFQNNRLRIMNLEDNKDK